MFLLMRCLHRPGADADRDALRPAHREWNRTGGAGRVSVLTGSALWSDEGTPIGHWGILEAATLDDARAYVAGDPFVSGGVVTEFHLTRLADSFPAERITPRMTP